MYMAFNEREYSIRRFSFSHTYEQLLVGKPNREINERILSGMHPKETLFHPRVVRVGVSEEELNGALPACCYFAEIQSDPIKEGFCGSILTLCWFDEAPGSRSILEIVEKPLKQLDWETAAEDFDF
jgi:hypothetical protein